MSCGIPTSFAVYRAWLLFVTPSINWYRNTSSPFSSIVSIVYRPHTLHCATSSAIISSRNGGCSSICNLGAMGWPIMQPGGRHITILCHRSMWNHITDVHTDILLLCNAHLYTEHAHGKWQTSGWGVSPGLPRRTTPSINITQQNTQKNKVLKS